MWSLGLYVECGSLSYNPEITTWAKTKSQLFNWLQYPGTPHILLYYPNFPLVDLGSLMRRPQTLICEEFKYSQLKRLHSFLEGVRMEQIEVFLEKDILLLRRNHLVWKKSWDRKKGEASPVDFHVMWLSCHMRKYKGKLLKSYNSTKPCKEHLLNFSAATY